jgi:hypothetical protein
MFALSMVTLLLTMTGDLFLFKMKRVKAIGDSFDADWLTACSSQTEICSPPDLTSPIGSSIHLEQFFYNDNMLIYHHA